MPVIPVAHAGPHGDPLPREEAWAHWGADPGALALVASLALLYAVGVRSARRRAGGAAVGAPHVVAFALGLVVVLLALISPLEALAGTLLSMHMAQHVLLVAIAAPLLAYGAPVARMTGGWRPVARRAGSRLGRWARDRTAAVALVAVGLHALAVWAWHLPAAYEAALAAPALHALEHVAFLGTAVLAWSAILAFGARTRPNGGGVAALFLLGAQGAALGALMAFAAAAWYPEYTVGSAVWGVQPLADQQLAGLLMWGFGGIAPVAVGALLLVAWLERLERFAPSAPPTRPGAG